MSRAASGVARFQLLAVAVLIALVVPVALAADQGDPSNPRATAAASLKKKVKKLTQRLARVEMQLAQQGGSRRPTGPAGGDLAGSYPNPTVAPNAIGGAEIAPDSLDGSDLDESTLGEVPQAADADNALFATTAGSANIAASIANGSVRPTRFGTITRRTGSVLVPGGGTAENGNYDTAQAEVQCLAGEMALNGGAYWLETNATDVPADSELWISAFSWNYDIASSRPTGLYVVGGNDTGTDRRLWAQIFCLAP